MAQFFLPRNSRVNRNGRVHRAAGARATRRFRFFRFCPGGREGPRLDTYGLALGSCGSMVLDALIQIKALVDSTLTFRRSCREGICGSCAMNVNGVNCLACITPLKDLGSDIRISPLPHLPVVKDLVPDL